MQSWDVPIDHGGRLGAANDGELIGARRLQAVALNLGREWFAVLQMTVIDDLPWARIGTALGLTPKTAKTRAIIALQMLVGWFQEESAHRDDFRARQSSTTAGLRLHAGGETSAVAGRHGPATGRTREKPVQRSDQFLQQCHAIAARASTDDRAARLPSHPNCMKGVFNELGLAA